MKIARNVAVSGRWGEWYSPIPAPSLRELSSECETEGVSSDGSTGPMVFPQAIIGSEIYERLRSSKYTPSVSHSLDSSLREGAGIGLCHSSDHSETGRLRAIFIAPTKLKRVYILPFIVPPGKRNVAGDFHRPYESSDGFCFPYAGGAAYILPGAKKDEIFTSRSLHNR